VFIEDPLDNSMMTFNFSTIALEKGTTFIFSLWVCVANGAGNFHHHLIDHKPKAPTSRPSRDLDDFVDNLSEMLLPDLVRELEEESEFNLTSTGAVLGPLGSDPIQSEGHCV
jgi:hypothetical protein